MHRFIAFATPIVAIILAAGWANAADPIPGMVCKPRPLENGRPGETVLECMPVASSKEIR